MNAIPAPRTGTRHLATVLSLLLAVVLLSGFASPAAAAVATEASADDTASADWASLHATAERGGVAPVIVTLNAPTAMPHTLSPAKLKNQKAAVTKARNDLRGELGNKALKGLKTMDDLPLISFGATSEDLAVLKDSPHVRSVVLDEERELPSVTGGGHARTAKAPVAPEKTGEGNVAPAGTTSNGFANALPQWWDYYRVGADQAIGAGYQGTGQVVGVLDTGVDRFHSWLAGDVVAEACYATNASRTGGTCPNGSWAQTGAGSAAPCRQAACAHGTHVAHTAAGTYGVAPGARIIAVQVFHPTADGPRTWDSDIQWGLKFVYDLRTTYRVAAVNMSIGGGGYNGYCDSNFASSSEAGGVLTWMKALAGVGIASVVSSGNDNYSQYLSKPACFSTAISVGNTTLTSTSADAVFGNATWIDASGRRQWTGSNSNSTLDLLAPGTDICSAVPNNMMDCTYGGTSMAAPHVAGAFATLRQARPGATIQQVVAALHRSGTSVYDGRNGVTRTRINVRSALGIINQV